MNVEECIIDIKESIATIKTDIEWIKSSIDKLNNDISKSDENIKDLEKFKYKVIGASITISVISTIIITTAMSLNY